MKRKFLVILFIYLPGGVYSQQNWINESKNALKNATNDNQRFQAMSNLCAAYIFSYPDSALPYAQQSLLFARKIKSDSAFSIAYSLYSTHALVTGNYPMALQYGFEALKFAERCKSIMVIGATYRVLTDVYLSQGDYERAVFYAEKGKAVFDAHFSMSSKHPTKYEDTLQDYSNNIYKLSEAYERNGQLDSALKYIRIVEFAWSWRTPNWPTIPYIYGNIYSKMSNYLKAIRFYHEGIHSAIYYDIRKDLMDIYNALANTYKNMSQWDSSIYYSNKVLESSNATIYPIAEMKAIELLANCYKAQNNIDSTAKYFELALTQKDRLFNQDKLAQIQNIAFNEQLRKQEIEEEQQKRLYRNRLYVLIAGLLVLSIIALILYRNNREKQKAKEKIEKAYNALESAQLQLIQSEKMASLGELTAGIAHEIQNPLNFVNNFSDVNKELLIEMNEEIDKGNLGEVKTIAKGVIENEEKINQHGKRADAIVKGMLQHSRSSSGKKELTNINALAEEYMRLSYHGLRAKDASFNATMKTDFDERIGKVSVIPQDIGRVILNLINNAFYVVDEKKKQQRDGYEPTVSISTKKINDKIEIRVADNGNGIPQKVIDKIFQPFFTTKPTGQGTGLGLSLAYDIVKAHGGELRVETKIGEGTEFIIELPIK